MYCELRTFYSNKFASYTMIIAGRVHITILASIANLENSEGGISVEGVFWFFGWGGSKNTPPPSKKREKSEVRLFSVIKALITPN